MASPDVLRRYFAIGMECTTLLGLCSALQCETKFSVAPNFQRWNPQLPNMPECIPIAALPRSDGEADQAPIDPQDLAELKRSHAQLVLRLSCLEDEQRETRRCLASQRVSPLCERATFEVRSLRRLIMFANLSAVQSLMAGSSELNRYCRSLCAGNAVKQVCIKSQPCQCTLFEFQLLASEFSRRSSISCSVSPSEYYVFFPGFQKSERFEIAFDTYFDFCQALELDVYQREAGLLKEKRGLSRVVRAVQVLGVDVTGCGASSVRDRKVLLGSSIPEQADKPRDIPMLYQRSTVWSEGSFEKGFEYRTDSSSTVLSDLDAQADDAQDNGDINSDINNPNQHKMHFSITWERNLRCYGIPWRSAEFVPGNIHCYIPAVVLRTRILTTTALQIFSSRIQGKYLKQIIVSPPQSGDTTEKSRH